MSSIPTLIVHAVAAYCPGVCASNIHPLLSGDVLVAQVVPFATATLGLNCQIATVLSLAIVVAVLAEPPMVVDNWCTVAVPDTTAEAVERKYNV